MSKTMRVGIIGAGLQGGRRGPVIKQTPNNELVVVAAAHKETAGRLAGTLGCTATDCWQDVVERDDVDAVLVCTPPHLHAEISIAAMQRGKHVLCEKPLTRTVAEAERMLDVARATKVTLKCGFNHRHHPAVQKAREWLDKGLLGEINFMRCTYGIGGRAGYEKEWRADPKIVSGGQLMEQGIHGIDLFRWFVGDFARATGFRSTRHYRIAPLEDNAFALFETGKGQLAELHSSLTQWINVFSFEVYGQDGYARVEGLGGGYGLETATYGKRALLDPFREETTEFRGGDVSWRDEWREFLAAIAEGREPVGNGQDGLEALRLVNAVYESSTSGRAVTLARG